MAKKNQVYIDIIIDDAGTTKRVAVNAKKLGLELERSGNAADKAGKNTDKLSTSTKNLDRNMRGTAKMSGNSTKEFSKMQQGMGGLVGAYATLAAQVFAVSAAFQFLQSASDLRNLIDGQAAMGAVTGNAYRSMTESIQVATGAQLKFADAARGVAIGTAAGLTSSQLDKLGAAAKNVSFALGRDLTDSYNRLIRGVTKAEPELLDELGIILRLDTALGKYAKKMNKAVKELDAFERSQAVAAEVLEQSERKFASIEGLMTRDAVALARFTKSFDELTNVLKKGLITGLTPIFEALSDSAGAMSAAMLLLGLPVLKSLLPDLNLVQKGIADNRILIDADAKSFEEAIEKKSQALRRLSVSEKEAAKKSAELINKKGKGARGKTGILAYLSDDAVDDPRSKAAAKGAVEDARRQISAGGERRGALARMNAQDLDMLDDHIEKKHAVQAAGSKIEKEQDIKKKRGEIEREKKQNDRKRGLNKAGSKGIGMASGAMRFAGYAGLLLIVFELMKMIYDFINKQTDAEKLAADAVENLGKKYKGLNEEISLQLQHTPNLIGSQQAVQRGNQLAAIDLENYIQKYNRHLDAGKRWEDMTASQKVAWTTTSKALKQTGQVLRDIDPAYQKFADTIFNNKRVTVEMGDATLKTSLGFMKMGASINSLPDLANKTTTALLNLSKEFTELTPSQTWAASLNDEILALTASIKALEDGSKNTRGKLQQAQVAIAADIQTAEDKKFQKWNLSQDKNMQKQMVVGRRSWGAPIEMEAGAALLDPDVPESRKDAFRAEQGRRLGRSAADDYKGGGLGSKRLEEYNISEKIQPVHVTEDMTAEVLKENADAREKQIEARAKLNASQVLANELVTKEKKLGQDVLDANIKQAKLKRVAITFADKLQNLHAKEVKQEGALAKAKQGSVRARTVFLELSSQVAKEGSDELANAKLNWQNSLKKVTVQEHILRLKQEQNEVDKRALELEKKQLRFARQRSDTEILIAQAKERMRRRSALAASAPLYRSSSVVNAGEASELAQQEKTQADINLREAKTKMVAKRRNVLESNTKGLALSPFNPAAKAMIAERRTNEDMLDDPTTTAAREMRQKANAASNKVDELSLEGRQVTHAAIVENLRESDMLNMQAGLHSQDMINKQLLINAGYKLGLELKDMDDEKMNKAAAIMTKTQVWEGQKQQLAASIQGGMETAFMAIVDGSKSAKDAFADMAKSILAAIAKMIIQALVLKMLQSAMPSLFGADGGTTTSGSPTPLASVRKGGVPYPMAKGGYSLNKHNYSRGGTARGAQSGYAATLHGNEAVVPLPDNRSIPVTLNGAGGSNNNVVVNVSMGGSGGSEQNSQSNSNTGQNLGKMVANAVQEELHYQKRSGGILNPYGVS